MAFPFVIEAALLGAQPTFDPTGSPASHRPLGAVSWGAILAGAAVAATLSLLFLILGTGLGLAAVSPWADGGVSTRSFDTTTLLWLASSQLASAGLGGYLAGRLRTRWTASHSGEDYFRDTAHGFLAWSVAALLIATLTAAAALADATAAPDLARPDDRAASRIAYFVDTLFRPEELLFGAEQTPADGAASRSEIARILAWSIETRTLTDTDATYIGGLVAYHTGVAQEQAEVRVFTAFAYLEAADAAAREQTRTRQEETRKVATAAALWLFVSLLFGALVASMAATFGGRHRTSGP